MKPPYHIKFVSDCGYCKDIGRPCVVMRENSQSSVASPPPGYRPIRGFTRDDTDLNASSPTPTPTEKPCERCGGSGKMLMSTTAGDAPYPCPECLGSGVTPTEKAGATPYDTCLTCGIVMNLGAADHQCPGSPEKA